MKTGFIYLLVNYEFHDLVQIGCTFKRPEVRVKEMQRVIGVPGEYELWHWWQLENAKYYMVQLYNEFKQFHSNGEFFKLQAYQAKNRIDKLFEDWTVKDLYTITDEHFSNPENFHHMLKNYQRLKGKRYNQKIIDEMEQNIAKYGQLYGVSLEDMA